MAYQPVQLVLAEVQGVQVEPLLDCLHVVATRGVVSRMNYHTSLCQSRRSGHKIWWC